MATSIRVKFNSAGFREILSSPEMQTMVEGHANQIAARAGEGFVAKTMAGGFGGGRIIGVVHANTIEARRAEAESKALSKAVM